MIKFRDILSRPFKRIRSWLDYQTGYQLTGAQQQQNEFNSQEAAIARDWSEQMDNTKYQRTVTDMKAAGVNPALAMTGGVSAPPSSLSASSGSSNPIASMSDIMSVILGKKQGRLLDAQAKQARDMGDAALDNARSNQITARAAAKNAVTNEGNLGVNKYDAETRRLLANNQIKVGDSVVELNSAQMSKIAQDIEESASRMELQDVEKLAKLLDYQFDLETYETNKALVVQQLAYRAVEMSEMGSVISLNNELKENARRQGEILDSEKVASKLEAEWQQQNPKFFKAMQAAGMATGVIGNILSGSVSFGRSVSRSSSDVRVNSRSRSVSDVTTHKGN